MGEVPLKESVNFREEQTSSEAQPRSERPSTASIESPTHIWPVLSAGPPGFGFRVSGLITVITSRWFRVQLQLLLAGFNYSNY